MVRVTHVPYIQEPNIPHVQYFVIFSTEECFKVLRWLDQITEPNKSWQVMSSTLEEGAPELHSLGRISKLSLCIEIKIRNMLCFRYLLDEIILIWFVSNAVVHLWESMFLIIIFDNIF